MKLKKFFALLIASSFILCSTVLALGYTDDSAVLTLEERQEIIGELQQNNIDEDTINILMNKLENGEIWDSFKSEYSDIEPESVYVDENGSTFTRYIYPDGSFRVTSIVLPSESGITSFGVSGGSWESGTGYRICRNALVSENQGLIQASFNVSFCYNQNAYDEIISVGGKMVRVVGGTSSGEVLEISRKRETAYYPAEATLQFDLKGTGNLFARTVSLKVCVETDGVYTRTYGFII